LPKTLEALRDEIANCRRCPRLVDYIANIDTQKYKAFRDCNYWSRPVPGFGDPNARVLIVGLAPAAHGGNRTGWVFTGDGSADFLMAALHKHGFANQATSVSLDDGLKLIDSYILAVIRCAPPDNKPLPDEILKCRPYLLEEMSLLPNIRAVLALGKIAMDGYIDAINSTRKEKIKRLAFGHGVEHELPDGLPRLFVSYHPSRQNTNTGKLTPEMLGNVLFSIQRYLDGK
jgi:uracil-DNA glycosylase family 4